MKTFPISLSILLFAGHVAFYSLPCAIAQRTQNPEAFYRAPSSMHGKTVLIPVGTTLEGRIDSTIGSSVSQPGERFSITMASPVLANGVDVIIPAGSQIQGEVVEATPAKDLPHQKGMPKPTGKLRVQLTALKTPDGMTYPLVASLTGETLVMGRKVMANPTLGGGVGYMGTAAGFEAVAPGMADRYRGRGGRGPSVVTPQQLMRDPLYGAMSGMNAMMRSGMGRPNIRSLVLREHDLFIDAGAPLSVKLDAPFKIGIAPTGTAGSALPELDEGTNGDAGLGAGEPQRRFSRTRQTPHQPQSTPPDYYPGDTTNNATSIFPGEGNNSTLSGQQSPSNTNNTPPSTSPTNTPQGQGLENQDSSF